MQGAWPPSLGLNENVKFLGFQNVLDILPQLGLMVLTSISEALPLVVLEAFASGLPCLATDVGSCRELIEGRGGEDSALGAAGSVVSIADPEVTAEAALALLNDTARWHDAQRAGLARVARYYNDKLMFSSYRSLYMKRLGQVPPGHRALRVPRNSPRSPGSSRGAVMLPRIRVWGWGRDMAGIGFEIRKILERDSYWSVIRAYGYAGMVSGGPWVLSILSIMMIGVLAVTLGVAQREVNAFQICVTYLMAASLIWTGGAQLMFTRFVADRTYADDKAEVLPNCLAC